MADEKRVFFRGVKFAIPGRKPEMKRIGNQADGFHEVQADFYDAVYMNRTELPEHEEGDQDGE